MVFTCCERNRDNPSDILHDSNCCERSCVVKNSGTVEAALIAFIISGLWVLVGLLLSERRWAHMVQVVANTDYRVQIHDEPGQT